MLLNQRISGALLGSDAAALIVTHDCEVVEACGDLERFGVPGASARTPDGPIGDGIRRLIASGETEKIIGATRVTALPIESGFGDKVFCVVFRDDQEPGAERVRELERQLAEAHGVISAAMVDYEAATEELRSAYEELRVANEELQAVNQELAASNQDLKRANDDLTVQSRLLRSLNGELSAVLNAAGVPLLLVDRNLRIRHSTPQADRLFHLTRADLGKPIGEFGAALRLPGLEDVCAEVMESFETRSLRGFDALGNGVAVIVRPYRSRADQIDGVVLAALDSAPPRESLLYNNSPE